jgi:hypothetical protein
VNNKAFIVLALSGSFAAGLIVGESKRKPSLPAVEVAETTDGAFRDGLFQARHDIEEGRKPHLAIGRWNSPETRASFVSGYWRGYRPSGATTSSRTAGPSVAELAAAGYRDGILDGTSHRISAKPFQPEQTANYQAAGSAYMGITATPDEFKYFYREGYRNGYELAYSQQLQTRAAESDQ